MTATMGREQAEGPSQGSCGNESCGGGSCGSGSCVSEKGAGDTAQNTCNSEQGCGVDKSFLNRNQRHEDRSKEGLDDDDDEKGRETRRRFVNKARVILVVGLALSWLSELGGEALSNHSRNMRREFISDSMLWDQQTGGTAVGVFPSSRNDIQSRWGRVALNDERSWHDEDNARAFNWLVLLAISAGAGYLFIAPKGKVIVEEYIANGVPEQAIKRL